MMDLSSFSELVKSEIAHLTPPPSKPTSRPWKRPPSSIESRVAVFLTCCDIDPHTGCWNWNRGLSKGYGRFKVLNREVKAHRFSYLLHIGPIPEGLLVCHKCDNKRCVNPSHLFSGTDSDNQSDCVSKGRKPFNGGELCGQAVLTWDQVNEIRRLHSIGEKQCSLARYFNVCFQTISLIVRNLTWKTNL